MRSVHRRFQERGQRACGFEQLFGDVQTRAGMIVTFLALLEMIRLKIVRVFQQGNFGPIRVYKRNQNPGTSEPGTPNFGTPEPRNL